VHVYCSSASFLDSAALDPSTCIGVILWHEWRIISRRPNRKNSQCELPDIGCLTGVEVLVVVVVAADVSVVIIVAVVVAADVIVW